MSREELYELADEIATRLGVDPETVMIEPPDRLSLTINQVCAIMPPPTIWLLIIEHHHGTDSSIHWTKEDAEERLFTWVEDYWTDNGPKGDMPDLPDEAIKAYFDFADESYMLTETDMPKPWMPLRPARRGE